MSEDLISVLIVDDNPHYRRGMERAMRRRPGIGAVTVVEDGMAAIETARALRPDVVLVDQRMPGLDGIAVTETMRSDPVLSGIHVVLTSAEPDADLISRAEAAGATAWVDKASSRVAICETVEGAAGLGCAPEDASDSTTPGR